MMEVLVHLRLMHVWECMHLKKGCEATAPDLKKQTSSTNEKNFKEEREKG